MQDAMKLLVNSACGIYAYQSLVTRYPLYVGQYCTPMEEWLAGNGDFVSETLETVFNPDNPEWCDNLEWLENVGLYVKDDDGRYWIVEPIEGGLWAIHPDAVWDDEEETYVFEEGV